MNTHIVLKAYSNTSTIQLPTFKKRLFKLKRHIQIKWKLAVSFQHYLMISVNLLRVPAFLNVHSARNLLFNQQVQRKRKQTFLELSCLYQFPNFWDLSLHFIMLYNRAQVQSKKLHSKLFEFVMSLSISDFLFLVHYIVNSAFACLLSK